MDNKQIFIDKPCSENWEAMIPEGEGRHCMKCCKTVVDFSNWQTEDIISYISKSSQSVCGQINATQVTVPAYKEPDLLNKIARAPVSFIRKVAAIIILCFGLAASGDLSAQQKQSRDPQKQEPQRPMILGGMRVPPQKDTVCKNNDQDMVRGEIAIPPQEDTVRAHQPVKTLRGKVRVDHPKK